MADKRLSSNPKSPLAVSVNDLNISALKRLVLELANATEGAEKRILDRLNQPQKNDLADLDEEMHGKPRTPEIEDDEIEEGEELPPVPKKGKK